MKHLLTLLVSFAILQSAQAQTSDKQPVPPAVYEYVSWMPQAGYDIRQYLSKNLFYPEKARENNIQGKVIVRFIVNEDGSISDAKVIRSIGGGCDEEALRVIRSMPKWNPGKQDGKAVKVYFTQPISFVLDYGSPADSTKKK